MNQKNDYGTTNDYAQSGAALSFDRRALMEVREWVDRTITAATEHSPPDKWPLPSDTVVAFLSLLNAEILPGFTQAIAGREESRVCYAVGNGTIAAVQSSLLTPAGGGKERPII